MQPRVHSGRKLRRRNHFKAYLIIASLALGTVLGVLVLFHDSDSGGSWSDAILISSVKNQSSELLTSPPIEPRSGRRLVYPYSVIPGGARSSQELKEAISKDRVVAEHYASFQRDRARVVELPAEKAVYVSYRVGNEVFWTKNKIRLIKGEKLITDGENYARVRCGNRVSETPQPKTSAKEPSPKVLETPVDPSYREVTAALMGPSPLNPPTPVTAPPPSVSPQPGGGGLVPIVPIVPIAGGPGPKSGGTPPTNPPNPPPNVTPVPPITPVTPVPEPGTLLLVASGLAGCLGLRKKFRK